MARKYQSISNDALAELVRPEIAQALFYIKVGKPTKNGCWEWTGSRHPRGYGMVRIGRRAFVASRVAWTIKNGPIPEGLFVCHTCDNPPCCNPGHLFIGDYKANARDRQAKGRTKNIDQGRIGYHKRRASMTHCDRGHEFDVENTYIKPNGNRGCRKCKKLRRKNASENAALG